MKKNHWPPKFFLLLFRQFCHPRLLDYIEGDLIEDYNERRRLYGKTKADWRFALDVILLFRPGIIKPNSEFSSNQYGMLRSYFKIALRTINKNKVYSTINVLGLTLGICACLTLFLIVDHEFNFDKFHPDRDRIFRMVVDGGEKDERWSSNSVPAPAPIAVRNEVSGIEVVTAVHYYNPIIKVPDGNRSPKQFNATHGAVVITDPDYFKVFVYTWLAGSPREMNEPFKVVLTEKRAHNYFGSIDIGEILGKEIMYDSMIMTVAGVIKDWDQNTDFPATDFISFNTIKSSKLQNSIALESWSTNMHSSKAFVKLNEQSSSAAIAAVLTSLIRKHDQGNPTIGMLLQPLSDIHFNPHYEQSPNRLSTLYALTGLAIFILILASVNFVNLSTAQSIRRSKEIGIRKVLGGVRGGLVVQFLTETLVLTLVGVVLAVLLVNPVLIWFSGFIPQGVSFDPFKPSVLVFLMLITLCTTLLAGFYPAKVLSSHVPSLSLRGSGVQRQGEAWTLRKGLIVFQFSISLIFIAATIVINNQMHFIRSKDKGFTPDDIITIRTKWNEGIDRTKVFAEKVRQISGVDAVALQSMPPMGFGLWFSNFTHKGSTTSPSLKPGTSDFIPFYNIQLTAGRNFAASDTLNELVINKTYAKILGYKQPDDALGELLYFEGRPYPIVGVVEDFHERSFHDPIGPAVIGNFSFPARGIAFRFSPSQNAENRAGLLAGAERAFKEVYPDELFSAHSIIDEIEWMHERDQKTATVINMSMGITIFISCMGIFGLSMFTSEMRIKEIGIRKVLGATVSQIAIMLSREFVMLIVIAILISAPVSWYFINDWLTGFVYRVDFSIWIYIISGLAALSVGLLTISARTISAALANPVESLRSE